MKKLKCLMGVVMLCISTLPSLGQNQQSGTIANTQKNFEISSEFSDPKAPVGNKELTVPSSVVPILNHWMRDAFVMYGPDGNYYMTGTTATPGRIFPNGNHIAGITRWTLHVEIQRHEKTGSRWA